MCIAGVGSSAKWKKNVRKQQFTPVENLRKQQCTLFENIYDYDFVSHRL